MGQEVTGTTRKRPLGITIIAILLLISAVIEIIGGISSVIGTPPASTLRAYSVTYLKPLQSRAKTCFPNKL